MLAQLVPETALADAEQSSGARLDLPGVIERLKDDVAFQAVKRFVEPSSGGRLGVRRARRLQVEQGAADSVTGAEDARATAVSNARRRCG